MPDKHGRIRNQGGTDESLDATLDRVVGSDAPIAYVIVFVGDQPGRVYGVIRNTALIGREESADIHFLDPSISSRHAQILNGSQGFEIEDLESRNGTFVEGQRVRRAPLRNGDRVTVGSVEFLFRLDRPIQNTIALVQRGKQLRPTGEYRSITTQVVAARRDDDGPSLDQIVGRLVVGYRFLHARRLLIGLFAAGGLVLGLTSLIPLPPRASAVSEVKLLPTVKSNPVDPQFRPPSDEEFELFFRGAERAFSHPDLVRSTLRALEGSQPTDAEVSSVAGRLKLEPVAEHLFHASLKEHWFRKDASSPVEVLSAHIQNYVSSEIDKSLREFRARVDFLRGQLKSVEVELTRVNDDKARFREVNADSLPEQAPQALSSQAELQGRQADLLAQIRRLEGELSAEKQQLAAETPLAHAKLESAQVYRTSLADVNRRLSEAYSRGLGEGHPEIRKLQAEKKQVEGLITSEIGAESSQFDRQSNASYQALRNRVDMLQGQIRAAHNDLADTQKSLAQIRGSVGQLPRVERELADLNRVQEATSRLQGQLFEKLRQAELQLNLEEVSAKSRSEIGEVHLERPRRSLSLLLRGGLGLFAGLFVVAFVIAVREGRRLVSRALATLERPPSESQT